MEAIMPRQTTEYLALLSSPGGLEADIEAVQNAISEVNITTQHEGVSVFPKHWRRDVHPDVDMDGQSVINAQIVDSADIIIALLHTRAGTPTSRASSGTIEEAERFFARKAAGEKVGIFIAFKREKVDPDEIDLEQLAAVRQFRKSISERGAFYTQYDDILDLGRSVRTHLPEVVRALGRESKSSPAIEAVAAQKGDEDPGAVFWSAPEDDDAGNAIGVIDVQEEFEEGMGALTEAFSDIGDASRDLNVSVASVSEQLSLPGTSDLPAKAKREIINTAARALQDYCDRLELILGGARAAARAAFASADQMISFYGDEIPATKEELSDFLLAVEGARLEMGTFQSTIIGTRETLSKTPRMTTDLNHARRRAVRMLDSLIALLQQLEQKLQAIVDAVHARALQLGLGLSGLNVTLADEVSPAD